MALPFPYPSIAARRNSLTIPPPIHSFSSSSSSSSSFCPRLLAAVACRRESTNRLPVRSSNSFTEKKEEEEQEDEDDGSDFQTGPSGRSGQYSDESVNDSVLKDFKWRLMDYNPLPAIVNPSPAGIDYSSVQDLKVRLEDYHPPVIVNPSLAGIDFSSVQVIKNEDLEKLTKLGAGAFGTVFHAKWKGIDVAIKRMNKFGSMVTPPEQLTRILKFLREAKMLSNLRHPNVVAFYGVVQDGSWETLDAVTEYMHDGSLRNVLLQKDRHLDQHQKHQIAQQVAAAMEYLHSKNVVHFDLKCDNLLVDWKDPRHPICKVGDVGLSEIKRKNLVSGGPRGTIPWMAPELFHGSSNKVSEKVDVYSYGIVLWEMLTGEEPYANMHYGAIVDGVVNYNLRPTIPSDCDPEWSRLIALCWAPNPAARPSFTEIAAQLRTMSVAAAAAR